MKAPPPVTCCMLLQLSNPASAVSLGTTNHTRYVVPWLPSWPSITIEPNATVCSGQPLLFRESLFLTAPLSGGGHAWVMCHVSHEALPCLSEA